MGPQSATLLALVIYAIGLSPVVVLAVRPQSARWLAPLTGALIAGLAFLQTGIFQRSALASADVTHLMKTDTPQERCQEVFNVLAANGILLEKPGSEGLVVRGALWDQLPAPVREAVTVCGQASGAASPDGEVPIVRR